MHGFSLGACLAALAFWGFLASIVVAGIWYDVRKREAQQETVRRLLESGQPIDDSLMDKLFSLGGGTRERLDRDFKLVALIMLPTAVGLALLGLVLGLQDIGAKLPLLGVAALVACIGLGFLWASRLAASWYKEDAGRQTDLM
jgi:O-antigen/teichoic acid export membrane protein